MALKNRDLIALTMAQAILGACGRVVGASLNGTGSAPEVGEDKASFGTPRGDGDDTAAAATAYLDIDFIPDTDRIPLSIRLSARNPAEVQGQSLSDAVSLRLDGRPVSLGGTTADAVKPVPDIFTPGETFTGDGLAIDLLALLSVTPGQIATLRIATSDVGPAAGGARVTSSGWAAQANFQAVDDATTISKGGSTVLDLTANDIGPGNSLIYVIGINGQDLNPGQSVVLSTGQTITLLDDGNVSIVSNGSIQSFGFTYTAAFGRGNARQESTANVTVDTIPCFVAGTMIRARDGIRPVERLEVGDLVETRDAGLQPIRWIGRRRVRAEGPMAPIRIARGALGDHDTLFVSPLHRVLVRNAAAELLYGTNELLAAARDLVDGRDVTRVEGGYVEYVHFLFDEHQIVWSDGLETESFLPGPQTEHCFDAEIVAEILTIFPELDPATGQGYGPSVRPALKPHEARLLVA